MRACERSHRVASPNFQVPGLALTKRKHQRSVLSKFIFSLFRSWLTDEHETSSAEGEVGLGLLTALGLMASRLLSLESWPRVQRLGLLHCHL
jgi:hypothetical protein